MGSEALQVDAVETRARSFVSLALPVGEGPNAALGWWWADPAGVLAIVACVILWRDWERPRGGEDAE